MPIVQPSLDSADEAPYNRLLLVDGLNVVRRIYEAIPTEDSPEKVASALKSSWKSIARGIREVDPTHFLAAFDFGGSTFRHRMYPAYKANRSPMPQMLREALPEFLESLNDAGLRTIQVPDVEADDTLGTLSTKAVRRGFEVVILSTDKDMLRLLHDGIRIRNHFKSEEMDEAYVMERFGIPSRLMTDYLALMGDASDGIPGVSGIGAKTAAKLLNSYGSLTGILDAACSSNDPIKGKVAVSLRAELEIARLSYSLVQLKLDVPLNISPSELLLPTSRIEMPEYLDKEWSERSPHSEAPVDRPH